MRFGGLIAAIVLAAIAAVVVLRFSSQEAPPAPVGNNAPAQQNIETTNVYVARQPIAIGTVITQDMITEQPWPKHLVIQGFVTTESGTKIVGMVTRAAFQQDEPFLISKLSNPEDPNFLAGSLPKGMRVITLQTNEIEGVGGFVFPGDFIDVMMTHQVKNMGISPTSGEPREETDEITETVLTNVKVLAVDQRASGTSAVDKNGNLIVPRSVSLMVSPTDGQRLRLAQQKGTLTLALRGIADRESADPLTVTSEADISQHSEISSNGVAGRSGVIVVRGVTVGDEKTMPPAYMPAPISTPNAGPTQ
jgi:pilus assembly protein CpaB